MIPVPRRNRTLRIRPRPVLPFALLLTVVMYVTLLPQAALAGFQPPVSIGVPASGRGIAAADFNRDGRLDLALALNFVAPAVLLNTTTNSTALSFSNAQDIDATPLQVPIHVIAADFNGDQRPDVAISTITSDGTGAGIETFVNNTPDGAMTVSFARQTRLLDGTNTLLLAAGDLDGDGKPDLVATDGTTSVHLMLNTTPATGAPATFAAPQTLTAPNTAVGVTIADFDGDGKLDIVITSSASNSVYVFRNTTSPNDPPTFAAPLVLSVGGSPTYVSPADFNGDGKPDLLVAESASIRVLMNSRGAVGSLAFDSQVSLATPATLTHVIATELNGDGKPDIAVLLIGRGLTIFLNTSTGTTGVAAFAMQPEISDLGNSLQPLAASDFNGDGRTDLAFVSTMQPPNSVLAVSFLTGSPSGTLQFGATTFSANEDSGTATVTVTRTGSADGQVSGIVSLTGGTAVQGQDFTFGAPQTLTWSDGDGSPKSVSIPLAANTVDGADKTVQLSLTLPANPFAAVLGSQSTTTLTIVDDDPTPSLNISGVSQAEGDSNSATMSFPVTLSAASSRMVSVGYATTDGSAKSGADYTTTSGVLTFAPGETSKTVAVPILGDVVSEPDETFTVTLATPSNATLGVGQATGVIQNDDVTVACGPRPRVTQNLSAGGGALNVHLEASPLNTSSNNPLTQIRFGTFQNATVTLNGQAVSSGQAMSLPANTFGADLTVRRVTAGQPTTVPFTVADSCGEWPTFVGGGAGAGF